MIDKIGLQLLTPPFSCSFTLPFTLPAAVVAAEPRGADSPIVVEESVSFRLRQDHVVLENRSYRPYIPPLPLTPLQPQPPEVKAPHVFHRNPGYVAFHWTWLIVIAIGVLFYRIYRYYADFEFKIH